MSSESKELIGRLDYKQQVRAFRHLALVALEQYKIFPSKVKFIQYGENATFKVHSSQGDFLLRIHRNNYHSEAAIEEELHWLEYLNTRSEIPLKK